MIGFLIKRPIAVSMVLLSMLLLGTVASVKLPVSLIPETDIPRISMHVNAPNYYTRNLENSIMAPLRNYLMQVNNLQDMKTDARNGFGSANMEFFRGTNVNLAFLEVNEQVDKAMSALPGDIPRPVVLKASVSDIPILYIDILLKEDHPQKRTNTHAKARDAQFLGLSSFADEVLRRRIEQLPQVAMADLSGRAYHEIIIRPDMNKLRTLNMPVEKIEEVVRAFNAKTDNIKLKEKQFHYHVRIAGSLLDAQDIGNLFVKHGERLWQLSDLSSIELQVQPPEGKILSGNRRAITMAIIKQGDARMHDLKKNLSQALRDFEKEHPHIEFIISRDQARILDHTLLSLRQSLLVGAVLAFGVMFLFIRDAYAPWLIIISVPSAAIISMLFFFLANISINVISVSGLILCVGMMIDNSIIVIDNINRHRQQGKHLHDACTDGTNEVIKPLMCSVLTSCSAFIPLILNNGLSGALFYEQAIAVSIGLSVSFMIAICVVPVYYHVFYYKTSRADKQRINVRKTVGYKQIYTAGFLLGMRNQRVVWLIAAFFVASLFFVFILIKKENMPYMQRSEMLLHIDWNENIHASENARRIRQMLNEIQLEIAYSNSLVGSQQFLLAGKNKNCQKQTTVYILAKSNDALEILQNKLQDYFHSLYPQAIHYFEEDIGLFDYVFGSSEPPLEVRLLPSQTSHDATQLQHTLQQLREDHPALSIKPVGMQQSLLVSVNPLNLAIHDVDYHVLVQTIRKLTGQNHLLTLADGHTPVPVKTEKSRKSMREIIARESVANTHGRKIPLKYLLQLQSGEEVQTIVAGMEGRYYPVEMNVSRSQLNDVKEAVRKTLRRDGNYRPAFHGSLLSRQVLMQQLGFTALIAVILLFLILAAQFESLKLPFIVLLEVPIASGGALLLLCLLGVSLNVMSMIGMIVMAGIIVNDSILKIDTINRLQRSGMPLLKALMTAGHFRLKAILMTSITTMCALVPFLFIGGMGGELQKPLAIAVIGGLGIGTLVSLFFIPVAYHYLYKNQ